jgi:2-C-methyl-D-erythritol 2,4-cyclodiphosphate synthase
MSFNPQSLRVGQGYDIHALVDNRPLILGGITIPYHQGLAGHSDADVLVHAIIDALLGASCMGDIGRLFPDNQEQYKGADSIELLKIVLNRLNEANWEIINIDTTIIAQQPKLAGHINSIQENLAKVIGIDISCVSVKAKTNEKFGYLGRAEAIAVHTTCLIYK